MLRVLITSYNNRPYLAECLASLQSQTITDWRAYLTDDLSTDGSPDWARELCNDDPRIEIIVNTQKRYQPGNYQQIVGRTDLLAADDICLTLDGDDWLPDERVFERVLAAYTSETWITWGSYVACFGKRRFYESRHAVPYCDFSRLRQQPFMNSHLRTFRAWLWRKIKDADLRSPTGNYWEVCGDLSFTWPMLEMAGPKHAQYLSEINYCYRVHQNNDGVVSNRMMTKYDRLIRSMPSYAPLD